VRTGEFVADYKELLEAVINRQLGILGKAKLTELLKETGLAVDDRLRPAIDKCTIDDLDMLLMTLKKHYGALAILGCRMYIIRLAKEKNLKPPHIFD